MTLVLAHHEAFLLAEAAMVSGLSLATLRALLRNRVRSGRRLRFRRSGSRFGGQDPRNSSQNG